MTWTPPTGVIPTDRKSPSVPALADIPAMLDWLRDYYPGNTVIGVLATARAERVTYRVDGEPGYGTPGTLSNYVLTKLDWDRDLVDAALADIPEQVAAGLAPVDAALDQVADSIAATAQQQATNNTQQATNNTSAAAALTAANNAKAAVEAMQPARVFATGADAIAAIASLPLNTMVLIASTGEAVSKKTNNATTLSYLNKGDLRENAFALAKSVPAFARQRFTPDRVALGIVGQNYMAFGGSVIINGREITLVRSGPGHYTDSSIAVARTIRLDRAKDGTITETLVSGSVLDYNAYEPRDFNISLQPGGQIALYKYFAVNLPRANGDPYSYSNWIGQIGTDGSLGAPTRITPAGVTDRVAWGNTLTTPSGKLLSAVYITSGSPYGGGVELWRSPGTNIYGGAWASVQTLHASNASTKPTETTIAYWGDRLVAVTRMEATGTFLWRETYNLEGDSGWTAPRTVIIAAGAYLHAPVLECYYPAGEVLTLFGSLSTAGRQVWTTTTADGVTWSNGGNLSSDGGSYNTLLRAGNGYRMGYYRSISGDTATEWMLLDVDPNEYDPSRLVKLHAAPHYQTPRGPGVWDGTRVMYGNPGKVTASLGTSAVKIRIIPKRNMTLTGVVLAVRRGTVAVTTARFDVYDAAGVLLATGVTTSVTQASSAPPLLTEFPVSVTLSAGLEYELRPVAESGSITTFTDNTNTSRTPLNQRDCGEYLWAGTYLAGTLRMDFPMYPGLLPTLLP
jgi:hypothetical protein